jgi:single-strand DNA-binding protein
MNINKVMLAGRIARLYDMKYFDDGTPSLALNLATTESWVDKSGERRERGEFHRVVLVGRAADIVQEHAVVGQALYVCGKLTHRAWGEGAQRHFITEVRVDGLEAFDDSFAKAMRQRGPRLIEAVL